MIKYYLKKAWAIILMLIGMGVFFFGEPVLQNHYWIERLVIAAVLVIVGGAYLMIVEGRMEKYGKC